MHVFDGATFSNSTKPSSDFSSETAGYLRLGYDDNDQPEVRISAGT